MAILINRLENNEMFAIMMEVSKSILLLAFFLQNISGYSVYSKSSEVHGLTNYSHLKLKHINVICKNRSRLCNSNDTEVCTMRIVNRSEEYKDFENSCFLFLTNMCEYPGEEYHIVEGSACEIYHKARRHIMQRESKPINATTQSITTENATLSLNATTPANLRTGQGISPVYDIDTAFDYHICPLSCPDTYSPVCVSANRGAGKYFKFYTFVNHCKGDVYYCKHFDEFAPPPDDDIENVNSSPLSWSYCGAFRYMQFARFSEVLSSMSHYGWLVGEDRYSRIVPPRERRPDTGR